MTLKQLVINIFKLENIVYYIQSKFISDKKLISYKKLKCSECWDLGYCEECGCDIEEMFSSSKPCPKGMFGEREHALAIRMFLYLILFTFIFFLIM